MAHFLPAGMADLSIKSPTERGPRDNPTNGFRERTEYKLYVSNLPQELSQDGVREIFNSYGEVASILSPKQSGWAFVTYRTHREAVLAIGSLDGKGPLYMKVEFAKERKAANARPWIQQNAADPTSPVETTIAPDYRDSGGFIPRNVPQRQLEITIPERMCTRNLIPTYNIDDEILYPVEADPRIMNPFENAMPHPYTNIVWTRGRLAVCEDGRRQVFMGRGYPVYQIPNHYPRMEENISSTHERRVNGLYEYGKDQLQNEIGRCEYCPNITKMRCSKCSLFYCSRDCQRADWNRHKIQCQELPSLNGISNPIDEVENGVPLPNQKAMEGNRTSLRTPNARVPDTEQEKPVERPKTLEKPLRPPHQQEKLMEAPKKQEMPQAEKLKQAPQPARSISSSKIDDDLSFQKNTFLPKDKFTQVDIMVPLGNAEYWVQRIEDQDQFSSMMKHLEMSDKAPKVEPHVGSMIACKFYNIWHRALILTSEPLTVHYIDYGNDEKLEDDNIRSLGVHERIPRFARKIYIQNGKGTKLENLEESSVLSVKMISENNLGVITVITPELESEALLKSPLNERDSQEGQKSQKGSQNKPNFQKREVESNQHSSVKSPPSSLCNNAVEEAETVNKISPTGSVLDNLETNDKGHLEMHTLLSKNKFSVTIVPNKLVSFYEKILCDVPIYAEASKLKNYQPKEKGELILGRRADGDWIRGKVLSLDSPVQVAVVDEGRVSLVTHCLPSSIFETDICTFGATCTILDESMKVDVLEILSFEVLSRNTIDGEKGLDVMVSSVKGKPLSCKALLTEWKPLPEQVGVKYLELKNDTEIVLTTYRSQSLLYVRSMANNEVERYNKLSQEVARKAQTAPQLKNTPVVGEMVIAKYQQDGNFYRAIVTKIDGEKIFIMYIDFGNVEISSMKNLFEMPTELKEQPSGVAKIVLKDVPSDVPMNEEVSKYFAALEEQEQPLRMTFEGIPSQDGVVLKMASGKSVNEKIKQLLNPDWKKLCEEKVCFEFKNLETAPLGKVGDTVDVVVLHTQDVGFEYFMAVVDVELVVHVSDVLPKLIEEYVVSQPEHYIPRDFEMCIAPYCGIWYRAACLQRNVTPTASSIFFVDYGNIEQVEHTNLRLMVQDFMNLPALANICRVQNLVPKELEQKLPESLSQRLKDLLPTNATVKAKIISIDESNNYVIELPQIRNILLSEKLV